MQAPPHVRSGLAAPPNGEVGQRTQQLLELPFHQLAVQSSVGPERGGRVRQAHQRLAQSMPAGLARLERAREQRLRSVERLFAGRFSDSQLRQVARLLGRLPQSRADCAAAGADS